MKASLVVRRAALLAVCLFVHVLFLRAAAAATIYYISSSSGDDKNDGQSPERAWQHLSKIYLKSISPAAFQPGDSILLKSGDQWEGQIRLKAKGTMDAPIILGAYGEGAKPLLIGEVQHTRWEQVSSLPRVYSMALGMGAILGAVIEDGKSLHVAYPPRRDDVKIFFSEVQPGTLAGQLNGRLWIRVAGNGAPDGRVRIFNYAGVSLFDSTYVQIGNLDIEQFSVGIDVEDSSNVAIEHNDIRNVLGIGIYLRSGDSDCRVESNTVSHSGNTSLYVRKGIHNTFRDNWVSQVDKSVLGIATTGDHMGIGLEESRNTLVEHNYFTYSGGIDFYYEQNSTVRYNYLSHVSSAGAPHGVNLKIYGNIYDLSGAKGQPGSTGVNAVSTGPGSIAVFNNTIFNASRFFLMGSAEKGGEIIFSDNIVASTVAGSTLTVFGPNVISKHNCFFTPGEPRFMYGKALFDDLDAYREANALEEGSTFADPQFVITTPATPLDFRLEPTSVCNTPASDIPTADQQRTYDHDQNSPESPVIGALRVDPTARPSGPFRQLCRSRCFGQRFAVAQEVYLLRVRIKDGASEARKGRLIVNGISIEPGTQTDAEDRFEYFLVRPGGNSIILDPDQNSKGTAIGEVDILPFDTSHGHDAQVIPWRW